MKVEGGYERNGHGQWVRSLNEVKIFQRVLEQRTRKISGCDRRRMLESVISGKECFWWWQGTGKKQVGVWVEEEEVTGGQGTRDWDVG